MSSSITESGRYDDGEDAVDEVEVGEAIVAGRPVVEVTALISLLPFRKSLIEEVVVVVEAEAAADLFPPMLYPPL